MHEVLKQTFVDLGICLNNAQLEQIAEMTYEQLKSAELHTKQISMSVELLEQVRKDKLQVKEWAATEAVREVACARFDPILAKKIADELEAALADVED